jgi:phage protein U
MLMSLGMFGFEIGTVPFQELARTTEWRHASTPRYQARPASQFLGPGDDGVTLTGALLPGVAGSFSALETLKRMGDTGEHWPLVDGTGKVHGIYRLEKISEQESNFLVGGIPRKSDFTIELKRVA